MKLDNNDKNKLITNLKKKEIVENVIYNLLKEVKDNEEKENDEEVNKKEYYTDCQQHLLLLSSMYH